MIIEFKFRGTNYKNGSQAGPLAYEKLKIRERIRRLVYRHRATNMAAEQFTLEELVDVVRWLDTNMRHRWSYRKEKIGQTYWKDLGGGTQTLTDECTRFYFLRKKDAVYFKLKWH